MMRNSFMGILVSVVVLVHQVTLSQDSCKDAGGLQGDKTCYGWVNDTNYICYTDDMRAKCCKSCAEVYSPEMQGCEYGDRILGCTKDQCNTYQRILCCETCHKDNPRRTNVCGHMFKDKSKDCRNPKVCASEVTKVNCCDFCRHPQMGRGAAHTTTSELRLIIAQVVTSMLYGLTG